LDRAYDAAGAGAAAVTAHAAAADPHAGYLTAAEGSATYDALGDAAAAVAGHAGLSDPHPGYLTPAEGAAAFDTVGAAASAAAAAAADLAGHAAAGDPHPNYLTAAEGAAAYDAAGAAGTAASGAASALAGHAAAADPHPGYLTEAEGDARYELAGGGATAPLVTGPVYVTSGTTGGDVNPTTSGAWQAHAGVGEIAVPAAAGEHVECVARYLSSDVAGTTYDLAVAVAGTLVWFGSSGDATPASEGDPAMYPVGGNFTGKTGHAALTVAPGHIDGDGAVHFVLAYKSNGTGKTYYSTAYPFRWRAVNHRTPG
jgi:hypothetical protein